jgi:hypothetical protein
LIGVLRSSTKNVIHLWDNSKENGIEACHLRVSMNYKRIRFLVRCLRFDDIEDREQRRTTDKLAPIRDLFKIVVANFQNAYTSSEYLTVDEQLLAFRGRCSFKQYSKPTKYGIKMFAFVDAKTAYTLNLETYVGTEPDGPYKNNNSGQDVVLRLVEPVAGKNIFSSNVRKL